MNNTSHPSEVYYLMCDISLNHTAKLINNFVITKIISKFVALWQKIK